MIDGLAVAFQELGLDLSQEQIGAFESFHRALYRYNETKNLTRVEPSDALVRHYLDSVLFHDLIPAGSTVLDIGTGPGFPAWPLACARPDLALTALDSNGKMLAFLESQTLENLRPLLGRAEEFPHRDAFDVITGRAVAPLPIQVEISAALCKQGGLVLPLRTTSDDPENVRYEDLGLELEQIVDRQIPGSDVVRRLPVYRKTRHTTRHYPRRWAEIKADPLVRTPLAPTEEPSPVS